MKKYIILAVILFTGTIFAQNAKPVLEPFGNRLKATYFYENGQVQQEGYFENGKIVIELANSDGSFQKEVFGKK